jgi:hypothetical protein
MMMKLTLVSNQNHHRKGEMIDICTPSRKGTLEVWTTVHVDMFFPQENPIFQRLYEGETVEVEVKEVV